MNAQAQGHGPKGMDPTRTPWLGCGGANSISSYAARHSHFHFQGSPETRHLNTGQLKASLL